MLIYTAGKYSGETYQEVEKNIFLARKVSIELWEKGHAVICPHLNTAHFEDFNNKISWQEYLNGDFNIISRCDAMVMLPDWEKSKGAQIEFQYAQELRMPIYIYPDLPELWTAEITSPLQCEGFREIVGKMYRTHLSKNSDYSPANILATGEVGLVTRLWDKVARLLNLTGFKVTILQEYIEAKKDPKNESINDTYMDMAVYAVIGLLLRAGKWGK